MGRMKKKRYLFNSAKARECQMISTQSRRKRSEEHLRIQAEEAAKHGDLPRYNLRETRQTTFH